MYTELLLAIPSLFIIINIAVIIELLVIRRKHNIVPDYDTASDIIDDLELLYTVKNKQIYSKFGRIYDYSYLKNWLSYHIVKYPGGKIPVQSASIIYHDSKAQYTMNFYDATSDKNEKYIKAAIKLFKVKKVKQFNVLKEANKVIKSRGKRINKVLQPV